MSRGDFGYGSTTGGVKTNATYQKTRSDKFDSLFHDASSKIFKINKNVSILESLSQSFDHGKSHKDHESKVHRISRETNDLAKATGKAFKEMSIIIGKHQNMHGQDQKLRLYKVQLNKLRNEFENSLSRYHAIQNVISMKLRSFIEQDVSGSEKLLDISREDDRVPLIDDSFGQMDAQMQEQEVELIREREVRIRELETDILDVNEIFKDLALLVHQQGEQIESIESHIETAAVHVEEGHKQLERAKQYQKNARKRICILLLIVLVVGVVLGLIIYFSEKGK